VGYLTGVITAVDKMWISRAVQLKISEYHTRLTDLGTLRALISRDGATQCTQGDRDNATSIQAAAFIHFFWFIVVDECVGQDQGANFQAAIEQA
jgi:hypothetical protein